MRIKTPEHSNLRNRAPTALDSSSTNPTSRMGHSLIPSNAADPEWYSVNASRRGRPPRRVARAGKNSAKVAWRGPGWVILIEMREERCGVARE